MKEVIRQTEKEKQEKLAIIRAERAARQEAYEREQAASRAEQEKLLAGDGEKKPARKPRKPKAPKAAEAPAEAPVEAKPEEGDKE